MPVIAVIDGIRIVLYWGDHAPPHFHAWVGSSDAMFDLATGRLLKGQLDRRSIRRVQQWTERSQDFLMTEWTRCQNGKTETTT